jgi:hypothetical protein
MNKRLLVGLVLALAIPSLFAQSSQGNKGGATTTSGTAGQPAVYTGGSAIGGRETYTISIAQFGCKPDSTTDNTSCINNAIAGLADGLGRGFPCDLGGYYYAAGQIVFKGHHSYYGDTHSTTNSCAIVSNYSGPDAAFSFVGAEFIVLNNMRLHSGNSGSPPSAIATFGSSTSGLNGSYNTIKNTMFSGYASNAGGVISIKRAASVH